MKRSILTALLMLFIMTARAEGTRELSNLKSSANVNFTTEVVDGKITWNVHYDIRESDYIDVEEYLKKIGQFLKNHHDCQISVKSYADKGTGNTELNIMYSRLRNEKAVAALVAAGVDRNLITAEYFGDTVQPFAENDKNRVTIITAVGLREIIHEEVPQPVVKDTVVAKPVEEKKVEEPLPVIVEEPKDTVVPETPSKKYHTYFTPSSKKAVDNKGRWFIGANIGAQTYLGDHNRQTKFKDIPSRLITPAADIYAGCWINRYFAARLDISGFNIKGLTYNMDSQMFTGKDNPFATPDQYVCRTGETLDCQRFNYINAHIDLLFNLLQVTKHDKEFFDLIPYVGYGWNFAWSPYRHSNHTNAWGLDMGIIFSWRLTDHWGLNIDAHGMLIPDKLDGDGHYNGNKGKDRNNKFEGIPSLNLGLSYRF